MRGVSEREYEQKVFPNVCGCIEMSVLETRTGRFLPLEGRVFSNYAPSTTPPCTYEVEVTLHVPGKACLRAHVAPGFPARLLVNLRDEAGEPHT